MTPPKIDAAWRSGWLGIDAYGVETHGFAELPTSHDSASEAETPWLTENGEVRPRRTAEQDRVLRRSQPHLVTVGSEACRVTCDDEAPTR